MTRTRDCCMQRETAAAGKWFNIRSMILEISEAQAAYQREIGQFAAERIAPAASGIDADGQYPRQLVREMAEHGLLGVTVPPQWGGGGRDYVSYALALEAIAHASAVMSVIASVNNSLVAEPIAAFGSDAQKEAWLRRLATGTSIGAFALSEEQAGSDAANQQTTARLDDRGYVLNGRKVWVANAEAADVAIVFAAAPAGISAFIVALDTAGVHRVSSDDSLSVRGLGCVDLELKDVRVGAEAMLGAAGEGFQVAMWALDGGRVAIAAQALGV